MPQFIITVIFGFLWWWVYNRVGAGLSYLMILGSVLAVCVCCCRGGGGATDGVWKPGDWSFQNFYRCLIRCWLPTLILVLALFVIGVLAAWTTTGMFPPAADLANILMAAVFAPLFVRIICCAYDS